MTPVVITGLGLVLPCGDGIEAARDSWRASRPAFAELPPALGGGPGGACTAFNPAGIIPPMTLRRLDRPSRFAWGAAHQAFRDAGLDPAACGEDMAIAAGTITGGSEAGETFIRPYFERGPEGASPMVFPNCVSNAATGHLALAFGIKGPGATFVDRENGTILALEEGARWLRSGLARQVLVVGTDGLFPLLIQLLTQVRRIARDGRPVAGGRTGLVPGEGAQAFLLERREDAAARGARIRAELGPIGLASPLAERRDSHREALEEAVAALGGIRPERWIGGACGLPTLDEVEMPLASAHPEWPAPRHPKLLWGELCGVGGALVAAALLEPADQVLVTAPASGGLQAALVLERVESPN
ncbi:MAG: hypothetical protein HY823_15235 [Acidobacteria bacterium]|nr:hypothetical protein [Acidobacteriota bacterium]